VRYPTSNTSSTIRALTATVALLAGICAALVLPASAAASACGDNVLGDWYDNGRIDKIYASHCYEDAIDAIPSDIGPYVNAEEVITRALQSALNNELDPVGGADPTPGGDKPRTPSGNDPGSDTDPPQSAPEVNTSGPSSVPIPLLVLGGMSILLLAAGGLGYVSRRRQAAHADDVGDDDDPLP
jgi:hypothetical protein